MPRLPPSALSSATGEKETSQCRLRRVGVSPRWARALAWHYRGIVVLTEMSPLSALMGCSVLSTSGGSLGYVLCQQTWQGIAVGVIAAFGCALGIASMLHDVGGRPGKSEQHWQRPANDYMRWRS